MRGDNPFTPSFGRIPPHMAGRASLESDFARAFGGNGNDPLLQAVFVGARGTGKTAMLSYLAEMASPQGWICANVSCAPGMLDDIVERTLAAASHLLEPQKAKRLVGFSIGQLVEAEWEYPEQGKPNWRTRMNAILDELGKSQIGLLITVDEVRESEPEMVQLASIYQHFIREDRRVALLMAGLPHNVNQLVSNKSVSFLRRASRITLGRIADYEIRDAFVKTIEDGGKRISEKALSMCVEAIDGFPYMMQLVGFRTWLQAESEDAITEQAAAAGISMAHGDLLHQIIVPTWAELSKGDRLFCMSLAAGNTTAKSIAADMGKKPNYVSKYKQRLLEQGVVEQDIDGALSFSLPGFQEYVEQR